MVYFGIHFHLGGLGGPWSIESGKFANAEKAFDFFGQDDTIGACLAVLTKDELSQLYGDIRQVIVTGKAPAGAEVR